MRIESTTAPSPAFAAGDRVILAKGPYQGTPGEFLGWLPEDSNWVEVREWNSVVRRHPAAWLQHAERDPAKAAGPQGSAAA